MKIIWSVEGMKNNMYKYDNIHMDIIWEDVVHILIQVDN